MSIVMNGNMKNFYAGCQSQYCEGIIGTSSIQGYYLLGINLSVGVVRKQFTHDGSSNLDAINAFDRAEIAEAHLGQINMITVSSFCGPKGLIWGYDISKVEKMPNKWQITGMDIGQSAIEIYDLISLVEAFKGLTGSVDKPRFPFLPGSHVPCAMKSIVREGAGTIYAAQACGIPENRETAACLLMEDFGTLPDFSHDVDEYIRDIMINLSKSVLAIGENQNVRYCEIFVGIKHVNLKPGEIGCAIAASPYFLLAQDAFPNTKSLSNITFDEWQQEAQRRFLFENWKMDSDFIS